MGCCSEANRLRRSSGLEFFAGGFIGDVLAHRRARFSRRRLDDRAVVTAPQRSVGSKAACAPRCSVQ
jgi:hypothetical protein